MATRLCTRNAPETLTMHVLQPSLEAQEFPNQDFRRSVALRCLMNGEYNSKLAWVIP